MTVKMTVGPPQIAVVLVEPEDSINVGSVARAMSNLGFADLRLVAPREYSKHRAAISACWGESLLDRVQFFATIGAAIEDCQEVYGFSAQAGKHRIAVQSLPDWSRTKVSTTANVALLFGPESTGLRTEHWRECISLVRIPSAAENPSFNLAQAVLLALYEIRRTYPLATPAEPSRERKATEPATLGQLRQLDAALDELGELGGFLNKNSPPEIAHALHHLFRRISPSNREVSILMGLVLGAVRKLRAK